MLTTNSVDIAYQPTIDGSMDEQAFIQSEKIGRGEGLRNMHHRHASMHAVCLSIFSLITTTHTLPHAKRIHRWLTGRLFWHVLPSPASSFRREQK
jgi:hypothetical protein